MISLMLVDDEPIVRKGIRTSIDWESLNIKFAAEAANGVDGLEKALLIKPDIIITDIRMPVMDGLEFCKKLREELPTAKIVILSGYDHFSYARKALRLGIMDYLLKPVGAEELVQTITRIKKEIERETEKTKKELEMNVVINENLPYLRSKLMNTILKGEAKNIEWFIEKAKKLKISLPGPFYIVMVIAIDDFLLLTENIPQKDKDILKFSVLNIAEEVLNSDFESTLFYSESDYIIGVVNTPAVSRRSLYDSCRNIQFYIKKFLNLSVTVGIGDRYNSLNYLHRSFNEAQTALRAKVYKGKGSVITIDQVDYNSRKIISIYPSEQEKELIHYLKTMDYSGIVKILDKILVQLADSKVYYEQVKNIFLKLLIISNHVLEEMGINANQVIDINQDPFYEIDKYETLEDIEQWIKDYFKKLIQLIRENKNEKYKSVVKVAIEYVNHYYHQNIGVADIAKKIYITPNYFSRVFKEETGETFTEWLNKFRVNKAKKYLKDVGAKTYEVAEKVGYNDYKYFTYVFKKYTGLTPREYRDKYTAI
jgi:two-component system response regulator YesN